MEFYNGYNKYSQHIEIAYIYTKIRQNSVQFSFINIYGVHLYMLENSLKLYKAVLVSMHVLEE